MCTNPFHRDHLAAWLLYDDTCPTCRDELPIELRMELKPKNEAEIKRLEEILINLDSIGDLLGEWEEKRRNKKIVRNMRTTVLDERETTTKRIITVGFPVIIFAGWVWIIIELLIRFL
jgi:hypothetical protein